MSAAYRDGRVGATPVKSSEYASMLGLSRIRSVRAEEPSAKTMVSTVWEYVPPRYRVIRDRSTLGVGWIRLSTRTRSGAGASVDSKDKEGIG